MLLENSYNFIYSKPVLTMFFGFTFIITEGPTVWQFLGNEPEA